MSLEELQFSNLVLSEINMSGLASLRNLQVVEFERVMPMDVYTASEIAMLAFDIGQQRRNIKFLMSPSI